MKSFDPMNPGDDNGEFEHLLRGMALRQPPADWKPLLLPKPVPPLLPKVLWLGLAACWAASLGLYLATPADEKLGPPVLPPAEPAGMEDQSLAHLTKLER
jgi:hypothetical protein